MNNKLYYFIIVFVFLIINSCSSEDPEPEIENPTYTSAKVVGYLPAYRFATSNNIEYCKLTHLNICFANPDAEGNIIMEDIRSVMTDAQSENPNIVIFISLAGGALTSEQATNWSNLIDISDNRPAFISKIVNYVVTNNLDGVDMDLEWNNVTSGYSEFVIELDTALTAKNKMLSAALPCTTLFSNITAQALNAFDFINIMAYDEKGPWQPSNSGQHSSYAFAKRGVDFWKKTVGIDGDKLTLGVPFYGYKFTNATTASSFTYAGMVVSNSSYADIDKVGNSYYNGRPTIKSKVELAKKEVGGIMIWELGQDSFNQYSLLTTIHEKYTDLNVTTSNLCGN